MSAGQPQIITLSNGREDLLEQYVLDQTGTACPKVGFVGTAKGDRYVELFYERFRERECTPSHLPLFERTPDPRAWCAAQDAIYVGGGNTRSMLGVWREWSLPPLLHEAWQRGTVVAGWSAGAICWFEQGVTDSFADRIEVIPGLGWLPGSCCPHYDAETDRRPAVHAMLADGRLSPGYALVEGTALHFAGTALVRAIAARENARPLQLRCEGGRVVEDPLEVSLLPA